MTISQWSDRGLAKKTEATVEWLETEARYFVAIGGLSGRGNPKEIAIGFYKIDLFVRSGRGNPKEIAIGFYKIDLFVRGNPESDKYKTTTYTGEKP